MRYDIANDFNQIVVRITARCNTVCVSVYVWVIHNTCIGFFPHSNENETIANTQAPLRERDEKKK